MASQNLNTQELGRLFAAGDLKGDAKRRTLSGLGPQQQKRARHELGHEPTAHDIEEIIVAYAAFWDEFA